MKNFEEFFENNNNESDVHEINKRNIQYCKNLVKFIDEKYDKRLLDNKRIKDYFEYDEDGSVPYYFYNIHMKIGFEDSMYNSVNSPTRVEDFLKNIDIQKENVSNLIKIITDLKIDIEDISLNKSADNIEICIELIMDYFDDNENLLKSIGNVGKFNL